MNQIYKIKEKAWDYRKSVDKIMVSIPKDVQISAPTGLGKSNPSKHYGKIKLCLKPLIFIETEMKGS